MLSIASFGNGYKLRICKYILEKIFNFLTQVLAHSSVSHLFILLEMKVHFFFLDRNVCTCLTYGLVVVHIFQLNEDRRYIYHLVRFVF